MNKLLELLNEYDSNWGFTDYGSLFNCMNEGISGTEDLQVISKKFGFIKWLVKNDKVDLEKLDKPEYIDLGDDFMKPSDSDYLIMMLSIQDNPIKFLIGILK